VGEGTVTGVLVNQSYWNQRITGQQRYATEIARRLEDTAGYRAARPSGFWAASTLRVWVWVQLVLSLAARRCLILSMTARAPLWRRRHVLVVHDLFVLTNPEWFSRRYVWTHAPLLRAQIRSAAVVVTVSQPVADQVARLRSGPVLVAPNAPSEVFRAAGDAVIPPNNAMSARGLEAGTYFLAVGSRDPRKNLARLVEAYAGLSADERRRHPLVLVGGGSSIFRGEDVRSVDGVVDAGYVTDEELAQLYGGARSVVFVSRAEGFGLPIVEAAAAGATSLLLSDIEVFRWICGDDARYVDPDSVDSIRAGLRAEIETPGCRKVDIARFDWDNSAAVIAEACAAVNRAGES
jgi:glycosyltransferase involved in cell wall biosynthesis